MIKSLLILGLALIAAGGARSLHAQAWCRLHVTAASGEEFAGSGAVVSASGQTAAILTAAHVVDGSVGGRVELATGATGVVTHTFIDKTGCDLALVIADCRGPLPPPIELGQWREGMTAAWHGYGSGAYATAAGATAVGSGIPAGWPDRDATIAVPCRSGDSGGPVVDEGGRLVGVVWGCATTPRPDGAEVPTRTHFAPITPVRDFLRRCFGQQPWRAGSSPTPGDPSNCPNGLCPLTDPNGWQAPALPNRPATPQLPPPADSPPSTPTIPPPDFAAPTAPPTQPTAAPPSPLLELATNLAPTAAAVLLGPLSGAGAGAAVATFLGRRLARKILQRAPRPSAPLESQPAPAPTRTERYDAPVIPVDTPPQVIRAKGETHYVPIADATFDRAYQWASEQIKRKYPGGSDLLEPLDSLIRQHLNAQAEKSHAA